MDVSKLKGVIPDNIIAELTPAFLTKAKIDGPKRLSNFLGQCMQESANFHNTVENLGYSAAGLAKYFSKHFPKGDYNAYAGKPEQIGNRVYANRLGNGDEASGDGYRYRGRGFTQLTGRAHYTEYSKYAGIDSVNHPELVAQPPHDLFSAVWFFDTNSLWPVCDHGVDKSTVEKVTKVVNGGVNGLDERFDHTQKIYSALTK